MLNSKDDAITTGNDRFNIHLALLLGAMAILILFIPDMG